MNAVIGEGVSGGSFLLGFASISRAALIGAVREGSCGIGLDPWVSSRFAETRFAEIRV